jgi:hypothetical protein
MGRVRGPVPPDCPYGPKFFSSPREAFVFSDLNPSLEDLAAVWAGLPVENSKSLTWDLPRLRRTSISERWEDQRRLFLDSVHQATIRAYGAKIGEQEVANLEEATKRHRGIVQSLSIYATGKMVKKTRPDGNPELCFEEQGVPLPPTARDVMRSIKDYVQLDRQVLGLADQVNRFYVFAEMSEIFTTVIRKYLTDPAMLRNIYMDIAEYRKKFEKDLDLAKGLK